MGFVAGALEEAAGGVVGVEDDWGFGVGSEDFFEAFGEGDDGDLEVEFLEDFDCGAELAFAAVDEEEVGDFGEGFVFFEF